jgi:hypothetical protein
VQQARIFWGPPALGFAELEFSYFAGHGFLVAANMLALVERPQSAEN